MPKALSRDDLAINVVELKKKLNLYQQNSSTQESLDIALETIRKGIKWCKSTLNWPPNIQNLELDQTIIEKNTLTDFYINFSMTVIRINSVGQNILHTVSNGCFLTTKCVLLPFTVKSVTGNAELVKIMNSLGHGVSYSKVLEIETTVSNRKLSISTTLIPNDIDRHTPFTAVYDNVDRLEKTLSGCGTAHRVNGVLLQQDFGKSIWNKGTIKFLNVYNQLTMLAENQKFLIFHALIKYDQQKAFRYNLLTLFGPYHDT